MEKKKLGLIVLLFFFFSPLPAFPSDFVVAPPPKSMDKYYADSGKTSEWIAQMRKLSTAFSAIFVSLDKKSWGLAEKNSAVFVDSYKKASEMIPEWEEEFDLKAANELKESILAKDMEKLGTASEALEKTCSHCHSKNNTSVWTRYHWPRTDTIKALDPIDEKELPYEVFMKKLSDSLVRISVNFEQEDFQQAWRSLDIFKKRLTSLRSVCSKCHVDEWTKGSTSVKEFFVGDDILAVLQEIKKDFATGEPSEKGFRKNIDYINKRSCKTCHLVHQPAAAIQQAWQQKNQSTP
jgi:cytochrome c556